MKKLILVAAPPASGKNVVSDAISKALGHVAYFDKDDFVFFINRIFDITGNERDMDGEFHSKNILDVSYDTLFRLCETALKYEDYVIANAPFGYQIKNDQILKEKRKELNRIDVKLCMVWVRTTPDTCKKNMQKRSAIRDVKKLERWDEYVKTIDFNPPYKLIENCAIDELMVFDNTSKEAFDRSLKEVVDLIKG